MVNEKCKGKTCEQCWIEHIASQKQSEYDPSISGQRLFMLRPPKIVLRVLTNEQCYGSKWCVNRSV